LEAMNPRDSVIRFSERAQKGHARDKFTLSNLGQKYGIFSRTPRSLSIHIITPRSAGIGWVIQY
jgi:hypothetical protein